MKISIRHNAAEVKRVSMEKDEIEISERDRFAKDMADMASEPIDPAEVRKARRKHRLTAIAGEVKRAIEDVQEEMEKASGKEVAFEEAEEEFNRRNDEKKVASLK